MIRAKASLGWLLAFALTMFGLSLAHADDPRQDLLTLSELSPQLIDTTERDGMFRLVGSFTNNTGSELFHPVIELLVVDQPLLSFDDVEMVLNDSAAKSAVVAQQTLTQGAFPIGQRGEFRFSIPLNDLVTHPDELGSVVVAQLSASSAENSPAATVARTRVLIPQASSPFRPLDATLLAAPAELLPGNTSSSVAQSTAVIEAQLAKLKSAATAVVLLDPALFDTAERLAERGNDLGQDFIALAESKALDGTLWRLPTGNPNPTRIPDSLGSAYSRWAELPPNHALSAAPLVALLPSGADKASGFDRTVRFGTAAGLTRFFVLSEEAGSTILDALPAAQQVLGLPITDKPWAEVASLVQGVESRSAERDDLTVDPEDDNETAPDLRPLFLASFSSAFASEASALTHLSATPAAQFDPTKITLSISSRFVMAAGIREVPATIANPNPLPIFVRIGFHTDNPGRISIKDTGIIRVDPGQSQTVVFTPDAKSNGITQAYAQLMTPTGQRFGSVSQIEISATDLGRAGWIIIVLSGLVFIVGTFLQVRRHRKSAKEQSESGQ